MATTPIKAAGQDADLAVRRERFAFDPLLVLATVGLVICSLLLLHGATRHAIPGHPWHYVERQGAYAVVGLALMVAAWRLDYSRLRELKMGLYSAIIGMVVFVLLVGAASHGSRRWIDLPFFRVQPSELGKVLLALALAAFVVERSRRISEREGAARILLLGLIPAGLVMLQPDLGTALVYTAVTVTILFAAGLSFKHVGALIALFAVAVTIVLVAAPAAGVHVLKPYQQQRLTAFLHPSDNPRDEGYQQHQSLIAVGSGEVAGRGVQHATQTGLKFVPERQTDFIFAVVGEEWGFIGAAVVLSLYALMVWRGLRIMAGAKDLYGALVAAGILAMIMFQSFVNVGMTLGIMPITGVPLPLMSYGGSSMLVTLLALGILQSIHAQGRLAARGKGRAPSI